MQQLSHFAVAAGESCMFIFSSPTLVTHPSARRLVLTAHSTFQRLAKWFTTLSPKDKAKIIKDVSQLVLSRRTRMCNFLEYKGTPNVGIYCFFTIHHNWLSLHFCLRNNSTDAVTPFCRHESSLPTICFPLLHCRLFFHRQ